MSNIIIAEVFNDEMEPRVVIYNYLCKDNSNLTLVKVYFISTQYG